MEQKLWTSVAVLGVGVVAVVGIGDGIHRSQRNAAFAELQQAVRTLDRERGEAAVKTFRAVELISPQDKRERVVVQLSGEMTNWPALALREAAYQRMVTALEEHNDQQARRAAEDFLALLPAKQQDLREDQVRLVHRNTVEFALGRQRQQAYTRVRAAANQGDDVGVVQAAEEFLAVPERDCSDPRKEQVEEILVRAREMPGRRLRDQAYSRLLTAVTADPVQDHDALRAIEDFHKAYPQRGIDRRLRHVEELKQYAQETPRRRQRNQAYKRLIFALQADPIRHEEAVQAANAFLAALPEKEQEQRTEQVRRLRAYAQDTPNRKRRDQAYHLFTQAVRNQDEQGVEKAARAFLAALSDVETDPRDTQVVKFQQEAREWPHRRLRTQAYEKLLQARDQGDVLGILGAAEDFLEAAPVTETDLRQEQVLRWYQETFVAWFLDQEGSLDAEGQARLDKYRSLISLPNSQEAQP
jgi:hypothetical protein